MAKDRLSPGRFRAVSLGGSGPKKPACLLNFILRRNQNQTYLWLWGPVHGSHWSTTVLKCNQDLEAVWWHNDCPSASAGGVTYISLMLLTTLLDWLHPPCTLVMNSEGPRNTRMFGIYPSAIPNWPLSRNTQKKKTQKQICSSKPQVQYNVISIWPLGSNGVWALDQLGLDLFL